MNSARILIVDDNPVNLKLASSVLEFDGYEPLSAGDAIQAQEVIRQTPPDLILMDIAMPGMDGLTLTRQLKADPTTSHIRIVALTAFAMKGDDKRPGPPVATATSPNRLTPANCPSRWLKFSVVPRKNERKT